MKRQKYPRYANPGGHIRVRFYNAVRRGFWNTELERLSQLVCPVIENGTVRTGQVDTYKREPERCSPCAYKQVEFTFFADSRATVGLLDGDAGERYWSLPDEVL